MQEKFAIELKRSLSTERLDGYRQRGATAKADNPDNLFSHYAWNIALSESLYAPLQCLEVCLRNSLHNAITGKCGRTDWYDTSVLIGAEDTKRVQKAKDRLADRKKPTDPGHIVAELTFGFWTSLFDKRYEQSLCNQILSSVFPHMPRHIRKRSTVSAYLNDVRNLRNRVFHHEPIWYWSDLSRHHNNIYTVMAWINPVMCSFVKEIDRFPLVYQTGLVGYHNIISKITQTE